MTATITRQKINMRVAETALEAIDEAASIQGVDRTSFVVDAAVSKARKVILEEQILNLTEREVEQIKHMLDSDTVANEKLSAAAKRLKDLGL